jgi:hypothetical protein
VGRSAAHFIRKAFTEELMLVGVWNKDSGRAVKKERRNRLHAKCSCCRCGALTYDSFIHYNLPVYPGALRLYHCWEVTNSRRKSTATTK